MRVHVQLVRAGDNVVLLVDVIPGDVLPVNLMLRAGSRNVLSNRVCQHGFLVLLLTLFMT